MVETGLDLWIGSTIYVRIIVVVREGAYISLLRALSRQLFQICKSMPQCQNGSATLRKTPPHQTPLRIRLIVGLKKENFGRECNEHKCCGKYLKVDMMIKFRVVDFPKKDGNERVVEVLFQLSEL